MSLDPASNPPSGDIGEYASDGSTRNGIIGRSSDVKKENYPDRPSRGISRKGMVHRAVRLQRFEASVNGKADRSRTEGRGESRGIATGPLTCVRRIST